MAVRRPIVLVNGRKRELPAGDTMPGFVGAVPVVVEVNFGTGARSVKLNITTPCTTSQRVLASPSLEMPAGLSADELECDMICCVARVIALNNVELVAASIGSPISGLRKINLVII
jgi:hypothetical protein